AVSWLTARGSADQWGSQPWSDRPDRRQLVVEMTTRPGFTVAESGLETVGALIVSENSPPYVPAASVPEIYVDLLLVSRRHAGCGIGTALLDHARTICRDRGRSLLRVDCWGGGTRELVGYYEKAGFTQAGGFLRDDWPGEVLEQQLP